MWCVVWVGVNFTVYVVYVLHIGNYIIYTVTGKTETVYDIPDISHIFNYGRPNLVVSCDKHNLIKTIATIYYISL